MKFLSDILAKAGLTVDGVVTLNNTATGQTPDANDNSTKLATTAWVRGFVTPYSLPIASSVTLGGVKIGSGLAIDGTGIVSVTTSGVGAIRALQQITATAGQTVFTVSGGYTPGLIDVFLNGVLLTPTAITSTNGTTFTLTDGAIVNDLLDIFVYNPIYNGFISTTDQVPEGSTNLYYTNARARAAISLTTTGTSGSATYNSSTGVLNIPSYIGGVVSIFGRTGTVVAVSGDYTTTLVTEGTNLYYTDARARAAISVTGSGSYDSATGVITVTGGVTSVNTLTGAVVLTTTNIAEGTNLYYTDARVLSYLTANSYATQTYVGTQIANLVASAPATLDTLNELAVALGNDPNFATTVATSIGTKVPQTRTITINGTTLDLSADRSFTIASGVTSFNTRTGAIVPTSGDYTTALVTESGNLYYTDARARLALSFVAGSGGYNSTTGVITIPTDNNQITNGANYITLVSLSSTATGLTYTNTTGVFSLTAGYSIPTIASQTTWDSAYTNRITSLTTTGTSGAATLSGNVLNIPQYQGGVTSFNTRTGAITLTSSDVTTALTYTPVTNARTLTINGDAYDLTADRTWTIGVTPSARTIQTYTATAAQTTFTVTGGYIVGLVDVFINGVRLTSADFTASNGTTVVLTTGTGVNNIVDVIKYTSAFTASSALRQVSYFTATAGQTSFTVSYTPGLIDVFYNGSKLAASEYTASNGTSIVLANAAVLNDALEIISYAYSVGAFSGLSTTRTLTINGTSYDLSADRTWTITNASLGAQPQLNGTGLVRMSGTTVSYDNATYATESYVTTAVANLVDAAPATLDTLNELAAALGDDPNFATTIATSIGTKQPQLNGTGFVKISGTTISYDNSTYLTTASASSTYVPYTGATGAVNLGAYDLKVNGLTIGKGAGNLGQNVALGYNVLVDNSSGNYNTGVGTSALSSLGTGSYNTVIGYSAGMSIYSGSNNTIVGIYAGASTLSSNVIIADGAGNIRFQWDGSNIKLNGNTVGSNAYTSTAYLPLAGGTLTGALSGTSASFSGNVAINGTVIGTDQTFGGAYRTFAFGTNANGYNRIFAANDASDGLYINAATGQGVNFRVNGGGSNVVTIASTGAATFSAGISAASFSTGGNIELTTTTAGYYIYNSKPALRYSYFGYSSGYHGILVGATSGNQSLFFSVDVSANPSGAFSGLGSEYVWRNAGSFITPNSINNGYNTLFTWNSSGALTFNQTVTIGSAVAATNVKLLLNGVASKAAGIEFQQNGTAQWYLGNGIASEDNNFELYNSNGTMAMKVNKTTNAIAFGGNAISLTGANPSITLTGSASHLYSYIALNAGTASNVIYTMAETYNQFGPYKQSALVLIGATSAGISIASTDTNGGVRLYTGGNTIRAEIDQYGYFYTYNSTAQNDLWTVIQTGSTSGASSFNFDVGVGDEGGGGNIFKVEAAFAHYFGMAYNCLAEFYISTRATGSEITDVIRRDTALAGSFTASKLNNSTLRVTKNAGSYGGGGKYWIRVTKVTY